MRTAVGVTRDMNTGPKATELVLAANADGTRPPLILINVWPGDRERFQRLEARLPPDQPVYGLMAPSSAEARRLGTMHDWAHFYENDRLARLPIDGPFRLVGWSFAGLVAYELARSLGDRAESVGLIDTWFPRSHRVTTRTAFVMHRILSGTDGGLVRAARTVAGDERRFERRTIRRLRQRMRNSALIRRGRRNPFDDQEELEWATHRSVFRFRILPLDIPVTHFSLPETKRWQRYSPESDWSRYHTAGFDIVSLDGDHFSIWEEPLIAGLAEGLIGQTLLTGGRP